MTITPCSACIGQGSFAAGPSFAAEFFAMIPTHGGRACQCFMLNEKGAS